ncbi:MULTISPECIES: cellulose synthase [unclassified Agrobacterium]|uniref:cellulose synthase n=1 Tax=unclassified Agrobacterium TaxID=2632611 RepID=UPI00244BE2F2|nr:MULTISPECIES: cellulose synthase [unclassified Agrobacterium]MDH0616340.1 cellulose synthase [Agrobacterium sp. GD03872]MDH0698915.1 cellulose synthase [Agrobacterium sp. GD03871]MDH1061570.1 cellulose synthase [Agrobacterium sp. GD03992]MDH2213101.1 cellulose synthase [Agrobacterium sp. GD03643]MDH2222782.1 cellulose synthase [Agrobacterium sp. GD03638]
MPMNKPLSTSALILLLIALAAFHWRDSILGRVSDVHTSAVGDNRAVQRVLPTAANPAQINAFVKNREMAQVTQPATPPVTVPATEPLPMTQAGGQAPQTQTAQAPAPRTPQPASADMPEVDLSALRYFAARGDTQRLQAEIARLRTLYPNWTPPADPLAIPENGDPRLDAMWQLYTDGRYAEVRKAIADRQQAEPGWQPPDNLIGMLSLAEARQRLVNASDLKQYATVVDTAANNPGLLTCGEVDVLWRVADAFANTDRMGRARDAYLYILNNCTVASDRLATVQKASALLPAEMMDELLAREKPGADGQLEFEPVKNDLARQFVAKAGEKEGVAVPSAYLMRLQRLAETDKLASDALLLGWYNIRQKNMAEAEKWFRKAREEEDSASVSQGLALALIDRNEPREAEDVMYKWRKASDDALATYLAATANLLALEPSVVLPPDVLQRIAAETVARKDAATAQQFGWYSLAFRQTPLALQWFSTALGWKPDDEPSAYGMAVSYHDLRNLAGLRGIQQQWAGRSQRIADVGTARMVDQSGQTVAPITAPPVVAQVTAPPVQTSAPQGETAVVYNPPAVQQLEPSRKQARRPMQAQRETSTASRPRSCAAYPDPQRLPAQQALDLGWCLMETNRPAEALKAFESALESGQSNVKSDAAYGQSLAYLRMGLTDHAAVSATKSSMDRPRATELQVSILADRAVSAFGSKRYAETLLLLDQRARLADERTDLMVLRGYSYLAMGRYGEAAQIFESLTAIGNRDGIRGLAAVRAARPSNGPQGG